MKNNVWEVVPTPIGKSVVTSRWLYKIKHAVDGSVEKYKARFVARGLTQKKASTMMRHLFMLPGILPLEPSFLLLQYLNGSYISWM